MTINYNFLHNGKQILETYKNDNTVFKKLKSAAYDATSKPILEVVQEIFKESNIGAMQALVDAGFSLSEEDNTKLAMRVFVPDTATIRSDNYHELKKLLTQAYLQVNFYPLLELLILKFNYVLNLNEMHFLLNDFSYKFRIVSQDLLSWFTVVQDCATKCERIGHVLGLSGTVTVTLPTRQKNVQAMLSFEGSFDCRSYSILINKLIDYKISLGPYSYFRNIVEKIINSFNFMFSNMKNLSGYHPDTPKRLYFRYKNNELTNIIAGWDRHSVSLSLYKGYLIYSNRGDAGDQDYGTKIYKIEGAISEQWIKQIIDKTLNPQQFNELLRRVINFANPIAVFPAKGQKHGNCSYANINSSIEAQFCLLEAERLNILTQKGIPHVAQQMTNPLTRPYGHYKKLTTFNRFSEINSLTTDIKDNYKQHSGFNAFYCELSKAIITQHQGKTKNVLKKVNEKEMAIKLFEVLAENDQKNLLRFFQVGNIADLFQDRKPLLMFEEEYLEETLVLVEHEYIEETFLTLPKVIHKKIECENIQAIIMALEKMDVEDNHHSNIVSYSTYYDTVKKMGGKVKNLLETKTNKQKPRYDRTV